MLNIYLAFGQFLIIWSGNLPEEINWYLDRIRGHWGIIITLDFIFHWLIPFSLLLSRDIKRNKKRLVRVCQWMIFAKAFDLFWLIEPNFKDAARNLHFSWGILEYIAVPAAMVSFWVAFFCTQLKTRPLVQTNDPHLAEILEPEHATLDHNEPDSKFARLHEPEEIDASAGYEQTDVQVTGIVVFLTALAHLRGGVAASSATASARSSTRT